MKKKRDIFHHSCELDTKNIIEMMYPGSSVRRKCLRCCKKYFSISFSHPSARMKFKSTHTLEMEQMRHLKFYSSVIHPFSTFRMHWEIYMVIVYLISMVGVSLTAIFVFSNPTKTKGIAIPMIIMDIIICCLCFIDIIVNFFTGYVDAKRKEVVLEHWKIIVHYVFTFFILDLISSVPIEYILPLFQVECLSCDWFELARFARYSRLYTMEKYFFRSWELHGKHRIAAEIIWVLLRFSLFVVLLAAVHYVVGITSINKSDEAWIEREASQTSPFYNAFYRATSNLFVVGHGIFYPESLEDQVLSIFASLIGCFFILVFVGKMIQWVIVLNSSSSKYEEMIGSLRDYMRNKQLPSNLQKRLIDYYEFRYQKSFFKEAEILNALSTQLRQEIILHSCRRLVENVSFFNNLPMGLLLRIVVCLRGEIYLPNDVIVKAGAIGECMFFITSGTVAVYTSTGKEVCHLEDGAHFGEIALVLDAQRRVASVVAIECCELYRLDQHDFVRAISPFPDLVSRIERVAEERLERTTVMDEKNRRTMHYNDTKRKHRKRETTQVEQRRRSSDMSTTERRFLRGAGKKEMGTAGSTTSNAL